MSDRPSLTGFSVDELADQLATLGHPPYRARQLFGWVHRSLASDFSEMTTLPKSLRANLAKGFRMSAVKPLSEATSADGDACKVLLGLHDGEAVESVLMAYGDRRSVCLSTQVGCPLDCPFCATGQSGFARDLTAGEILDQALHFARALKERGESLTHVVFMGMGEPLMNYEASWKAIRILTDPLGQGLSARRITISTAGWLPGIRRAAREGLPVKLALSLHAPVDSLRDRLVPLNRRYPLEKVAGACREYVRATGRRLSLEYALVDGLNDDPALAEPLARLFGGLPIHVNLIPLSPASQLRPSPPHRALAFARALRRLGISHTVRSSRGADIEAACGQLRRRAPAP